MTINDKKLTKKQATMIEALGRSLGIITPACQETGISRETHYRWLRDYPVYAESIQSLEVKKEDIIEKAFLSLVMDKNPQAVIHAVKTKLKHRGYGEEVINNQQMNYTFKIERPEVKNGHSVETK